MELGLVVQQGLRDWQIRAQDDWPLNPLQYLGFKCQQGAGGQGPQAQQLRAAKLLQCLHLAAAMNIAGSFFVDLSV